METFSALLAFCAGNSPGTGEFPTQRPVTRSFDVFFDLRRINGWVNKCKAGDLRRIRSHHDVTVMQTSKDWYIVYDTLEAMLLVSVTDPPPHPNTPCMLFLKRLKTLFTLAYALCYCYPLKKFVLNDTWWSIVCTPSSNPLTRRLPMKPVVSLRRCVLMIPHCRQCCC